MKNQKSFIFDLNRCTGCGACVVACATENYGKQDTDWREVYTFNESRHPQIPLFNLSMACNHCVSPACKKSCPALAYTKDAGTGAVVHHAGRCIGCTYCTWACPYDAPRYSREKGVVEKCDFCIDRQRDGEVPACVCSCPTNALRWGDLDAADETVETQRVIGFTDTRLQPSVRFKDLRTRRRVPEATAAPSEEEVGRLFESSQRIPERKITLKGEWPLLLFTLLASLLTAWLTAMLLIPSAINPYLFLGAGIVGMGVTIIHLGKKARLFRAIFNLKGSWLSREIFCFSIFLGLAGAYLLFFPYMPTVGRAAVAAGFISLFCIDKLYQVAMQVGRLNFHSAHVLLNGLYLTGILTGSGVIFGLMGGLKFFLYLYRKVQLKQAKRKIRPLVSLLRVGLGFLLPLAFSMRNYYGYAIVGVIIGEVIDRMEYYDELDVITPPKQMMMDLEKLI
ncbi:MAG: dimethyl sulfoxide reductase anchor subunit [bacterium]|nr:dimethyl sulfoxide reductase anchor subunit [bacterium]